MGILRIHRNRSDVTEVTSWSGCSGRGTPTTADGDVMRYHRPSFVSERGIGPAGRPPGSRSLTVAALLSASALRATRPRIDEPLS